MYKSSNTTTEYQGVSIFGSTNFESEHFGSVRVTYIQGEPHFVAKDIAKCLDYPDSSIANMNRMCQHVPEEWKGRHPIPTLGGAQEMLTLSEAGLFFFVNRSDKPKAIPFQKWVSGVVLPSVRKHGAYMTAKKIEEVLCHPDTIIKIALNLKAEQEKSAALEAVVKENAPKVEFYDNFANADGLYGLQNAGRALSARPNLFIRWLKRDYLFYQDHALVPRIKYRQMDIFDVRVYVVGDRALQRTFVTPKGIEYLSKRMPPEIRMKHDVCGELGLLTHNMPDGHI